MEKQGNAINSTANKGSQPGIYICSNVGIDYFFFLQRTIEAAGYDVTPICFVSESTYRSLAKKHGIRKIWLRAQMYLLYPVSLILRSAFKKGNSIFIVTSNTFYAPTILRFFTNPRKVKIVHLLYDLYPDAMEVAWTMKPGSFSSNMVGKVTKKNQSCDATVYLGDFLRQHAETRWGKPAISEIIDIATDLSLYKDDFDQVGIKEKIVIHSGGQLGYLHDVQSIIECIRYVFSSDLADKVEFNFYISGAQASILESSLKDYPVKIIPPVEGHIWRKDINKFHVGLISLNPGAATVCMPSKIYSMMAGGMAILGICPKWSDMGMLIDNLDAGWVVNNSPYNDATQMQGDLYLENIKKKRGTDGIQKDFLDALRSVVNDRALLVAKRKNAYTKVREYYNIDKLSKKWDDVIKAVANG